MSRIRSKILSITPAVAVALALGTVPVTSADWSVDILGPHGSVSFGDRPFVEYAQVQSVPSYHDVLSPYGDWVSLPDHGEVWAPRVERGWRPYLYGRWVFTDSGWMWVNYEPWGYIPHHYGDWRYVGGHGWVWLPGYDWAPSRVSWYSSGSYVGWYPQGAFRDSGVDIDINLVTIVNVNMFTSPRLREIAIDPRRIDRDVRASLARRDAFRPEAPDRQFIQKHVRERIDPVLLESRELKVGDRAIRIAAPKGEVRRRQIEQANVVAPRVVKPKVVLDRTADGEPRREAKPAARLEPRDEKVTKPVTRPEPRAEKATRPGTRPEPRGEKATMPETRPEPRAEKAAKPVTRPEPRAEKATMPRTRPEPKAEKAAKPATRPEPKAEKAARPATRPEPRAEKAAKPATRPEPRAEKAAKPVTRPATKPEATPASKTSKPDANAAPKGKPDDKTPKGEVKKDKKDGAPKDGDAEAREGGPKD